MKETNEFTIPDEFCSELKDKHSNILFMSLSGSHVYNTPNKDSDVDLRGCHISSTEDIVSLNPYAQTIEKKNENYDIESHEIYKFLYLILKKNNGNFYEALYSPVILYKNEFFDELKDVASKALSKSIYWHYFGFATHMLKHSYHSEERRYRKNVLYLFRNLLSGTYVLEKGEFVLNFDELCTIYDFKPDFHFITMAYQKQAKELFVRLLDAKESSSLKDEVDDNDYMRANKLLLKIRKKYWKE